MDNLSKKRSEDAFIRGTLYVFIQCYVMNVSNAFVIMLNDFAIIIF